MSESKNLFDCKCGHNLEKYFVTVISRTKTTLEFYYFFNWNLYGWYTILITKSVSLYIKNSNLHKVAFKEYAVPKSCIWCYKYVNYYMSLNPLIISIINPAWNIIYNISFRRHGFIRCQGKSRKDLPHFTFTSWQSERLVWRVLLFYKASFPSLIRLPHLSDFFTTS